jgi:hypothetical protein
MFVCVGVEERRKGVFEVRAGKYIARSRGGTETIGE